jgi:hypothetical protein
VHKITRICKTTRGTARTRNHQDRGSHPRPSTLAISRRGATPQDQKWRELNSNSKAIPDRRPQNSHHISSVVEIFEGHPQGSTEAGRIEGVTEQARRRGEKRRNHRSLTMRGHARLILLPRSPTSPSPIYCKINTGITTHDLCDSPLFVGRIHS